MKLEKILKEIAEVEAYVQDWDRSADVPVIEKDIVLLKLRNLYEEVRRAETGSVPPAAQESCQGLTEQSTSAPGPEPSIVEPVVFKAEDGSMVMDESIPEPIPGFVQSETVIGITEPGEMDEPAGETPAETKKKALRSLYGDDEKEEEKADDDFHLSGYRFEREVPRENAVEEHTVAFRDTVNDGDSIVADMYTRASDDVASMINSGHVSSLSASIGINDKFLMVRDMFGGDQSAFDAAIRELESFDDLDNAVIHIYENYDWNPDSEGVKLLMDLLTRKLS